MAATSGSRVRDDANFSTLQRPRGTAVVLVTGLTYLDTLPEDLMDAFSVAGAVKEVDLLWASDVLLAGRGHDDGYGIVEFDHRHEAQAAIDMIDGKIVAGHVIRVNWLHKQQQQADEDQDSQSFYLRVTSCWCHDLVELEVRSDGRLRFAASCICKDRKGEFYYEMFVSEAALLLLQRFIRETQALIDSDAGDWPSAGSAITVGRDELDFVIAGNRSSYSTSKIRCLTLIRKGLRWFFYLHRDILAFARVLIRFYFNGVPPFHRCNC